jgi:DNA-3-methyladenine glycosylase II
MTAHAREHPPAAERAAAHAHLLLSDPPMAALVAAHGPIDPYRRPHRVPLQPGDAFAGLVFHVVGQSISERSALAVFTRLRDRLDGAITSAPMAAASVQSLRDTGLSMAKSRALHGLAAAVERGDLDLPGLADLGDEQVVARLIALPGIGPWTAQIFLLYELQRPDAFPASEIGLRKALAALDELAQPPSAEHAINRAVGWRPYRSYAAGHLWRVLP